MSTVATPEVLWAQRSNKTDATKNLVYLTISVPDVNRTNVKLDLTSKTVSFFGHSESLKRDFQVEIEFYSEIDENESKINHRPKNIELILRKKELREEYWPRLTKDSKKYHFIKTDFSRWVDEDEQEGAPDDNPANFGGMGGMPGMGDMGSMMGDMGSMMGGAGGDYSGLDFSKPGGDTDEDEDDEDEEMPALEGEDDKDKDESSSTKSAEPDQPAEPSTNAKIQEVS